jgi:hypothetical protein
MDKRSHRRIRELMAPPAFQGLDEDAVLLRPECAILTPIKISNRSLNPDECS